MNNLTLTPEALTTENFSPFGQVISCENTDHTTINDGYAEKYADLALIDTKEDQGSTSIHIFVAKKRQFPFQITMLEKHPFFSQAFIPRAKTQFVVVVAPPSEDLVIENLRAFISNGDQGINYSRGVWHFPLITLDDNSHFIVIDRKHKVDIDSIEQCIVRPINDVHITLELSL
jgi:ureidoglycolate lyase